MFISTTDNVLVNLSHVVEIVGFDPLSKAWPDEFSTLRLASGAEYEARDTDISRALHRARTLTPALPGTKLLTNDGGNIVRTPVIAWAVTHHGDVAPVTPAGPYDVQNPGDYLPIEFENGQVCTTEGSVYANAGMWLQAEV